MTLYRRIWTAVVAVVVAVGAAAGLTLADPTTVVVGALLCGFLTAFLAAAVVWPSEHPHRLRVVGRAAAVATIGWTALLGLVELVGPGVLGLVVVLGGAGLPFAVRRMRLGGQADDASGLRPDCTDGELRAQLAELSLTELCAGWRTGVPAAPGPADPDLRARLVQVRGIYLDELERRDPAGFADWLQHDALRTDPEGYVGRGHGAAA
jgi:hypothetical protein